MIVIEKSIYIDYATDTDQTLRLSYNDNPEEGFDLCIFDSPNPDNHTIGFNTIEELEEILSHFKSTVNKLFNEQATISKVK